MPFDSQGKFTRLHNWEDDRVNDIDIVTDHADEEDDNFAAGLSQTFLRDGRAPMQGDFNGGGFKIKNIANGSVSGDATNYGQLNKVKEDLQEAIKTTSNGLWLVGDIKTSVRAANHENWLLCDGQAVNRSEYAALFELIGTNFGSGDGVNTFNVPDYRGKFLRGLGGDSAEDIYTTQEEGLPDHEHTYTAESRHGRSGVGPAGAWWSDGDVSYGKPTGTMSKASASNEIYGKSEHVTPINQAINYFIKAKDE